MRDYLVHIEVHLDYDEVIQAEDDEEAQLKARRIDDMISFTNMEEDVFQAVLEVVSLDDMNPQEADHIRSRFNLK